MIRRPLISLVLIALPLLAAAPASFGQVIRLAAKATVEPRQDVRLGDIATISGTDRRTAEDLSNTVILSKIDSPRSLKAESVLLALMSQRGPTSLDNLQISGSAECSLRLATAASALSSPYAPPANTVLPATPPVLTASVVSSARPDAPAAQIPNPAILSGIINARVRQELGLASDEFRISIETINPLVDTPLPANRKWLCRPLVRTLLGNVPFEAQLVEGNRILEKLNIQTHIERRQSVIITTTRFERGDIVTPGNLRLEQVWLDRNLPCLFSSPKSVVGLEAQRPLEVGTMLDQRDFKAALMAVKNDAVSVIYLSGPLRVQMRGRAMEDGKLHDQIEIRNELTAERYQAVLIGKRLAVVGGTLDPADELKLRESR